MVRKLLEGRRPASRFEIAFGLIFSVSVLVGVYSLSWYIIKYAEFPISIGIPFAGAIFGVLAVAISKALSTKEGDVFDRQTSSRIEQSERRLQGEIERQINKRVSELVSSSLNSADQAIARVVGDRLDIGLLSAIDDALARRVDHSAREGRRWQHIEDAFDRIRLKLDGPASRAERTALYFQVLSGVLALFGIIIAYIRVGGSGDFLLQAREIINGTGAEFIWASAFMQAAPWVGLVLLIEFTAFLFFRFYLRAIELQRYFTREQANMEARFAALRIVLDLGSAEQSVEVARAMMAVEANTLATENVGTDASGAASLVSAIGTAVKDLRGGSGAT